MSDVSSSLSRATSPVNSPPPDNLPTARPYRFTWDPASRRPGPESVSGTTEGRGGDDFAGPHPLAFLNNSTTSLALGSIPPQWSSSRTGFHAISTVLNNPRKKQAPPKAHSLLPPVPAADLPRVRRKDFESYLKVITPEWELYERNSQLGTDSEAQIDNQRTPRNSFAREEPLTPQASLSALEIKQIPPLHSVPAVFFQKDFNLADPRTFATVTEQDVAHLASQDDAVDPLSLSHSIPLLERFSHYADTVEQHLVREISIRSTSFFAALTNLHDLQSESERCLDRIGKLRTQLREVDDNGAKRGLEMVRKECKMANLGKVRDAVRMIGGVLEMTVAAKSLVSAGQWGEAIGVIEEIENTWDLHSPVPSGAASGRPLPGLQNGHLLSFLPEEPEKSSVSQTEMLHNKISLQPQALQLSSLQAFSALPSHLRALTMEIAASLSSELVSILRNDHEMRISLDGKPNLDMEEGLKDRLKPLLMNLIRTKGLKEGVLSWREVVLSDVRGIIKKILPAFDPDEDDTIPESGARAGLANHLRNMSQPDFVVLIQKIYRSLLNGIKGLQAQSSVIVNVLSVLGSERHKRVTDTSALEDDLSDIVSSYTELSSTHAAKVISYRAEQHASLDLTDFLTFFGNSWTFVINCETICRRMIVGLRGTVVGQAKLFLQAFHATRITRSVQLVEDEKWIPTDVNPTVQKLTNILIDSAVRDPPDLVIKSEAAMVSLYEVSSPIVEPNSSIASPRNEPHFDLNMKSNANGTSAPSAPTVNTKHLRIEERSYNPVLATTEVLMLLVDYLMVVVNLPMLTIDTMSRVIEFLKSFNSKTCQVVLGAGAVRSAGLKNITAKHLALASQSLSIIFELIPYVRETFRRHLSQQQAVMLVEFDKLKRDYQEHQNEIHSKLVAIMGDRLNVHVNSLKAVDWATPKPGGGVNDYMEILVKETVALYKVLSRYLLPSVVEYVMSQVFAAINHRLSEEYMKIELPHQEAKIRLLEDAKFIHTKLSVLKNVGAPTGMLETVVTEKVLGRGNSNPNSNSQQGPSKLSGPSSPSLTRSNTLSANQRLKGLLSGKSPTFPFISNSDNGLPRNRRTPSPPPVPPSSDKPRSPLPQHSLPSVPNNSVYGSNTSLGQLTNGSSQLSLATSVSSIAEPSGSQGFKQVEIKEGDSAGVGPDAESGPDNPKWDLSDLRK